MQDGNLLENDVLAGEVSVDRREGVELVLEVVLVLRVKVAKIFTSTTIPKRSYKHATYTRINLEPSWATLVLLPTISEGKTSSSRIFSWTAVRVRDRGRFCFWAETVDRDCLGRTRRWERKTMNLSESFFSSSRVSLRTVSNRPLGYPISPSNPPMVNAEPPWGGGPKKSLRLPWPCSAYAIFPSLLFSAQLTSAEPCGRP